MAVFDISRKLFGTSKDPYNHLPDIVAWLSENVGEYYGKGEDPVIRIGSGWEIYATRNPYDDEDGTGGVIISFHLDITDEAKSTLFALKWT